MSKNLHPQTGDTVRLLYPSGDAHDVPVVERFHQYIRIEGGARFHIGDDRLSPDTWAIGGRASGIRARLLPGLL
jgi:hypothetical protein